MKGRRGCRRPLRHRAPRRSANNQPGWISRDPKASPDDNYDDPEEAEAEPQPLPLEIALGADLEVMLADPRAQALLIQAVTDNGAVD